MKKLLHKFRRFNKTRTNRLKNPLFFYETCKFCQEMVSKCEPMYSLCNCKGTLKWCHSKCVLESMKYQTFHPNVCKICLTPYNTPID